jgi:hypothetical protein
MIVEMKEALERRTTRLKQMRATGRGVLGQMTKMVCHVLVFLQTKIHVHDVKGTSVQALAVVMYF